MSEKQWRELAAQDSDIIATQAAQIKALTKALQGAEGDILACMKRLSDQNASVAVQNTLNERLKLVRAALAAVGEKTNG